MNENLQMASKVISIALFICSVSLICNRVLGTSSRKDNLVMKKEVQFPKQSRSTSIPTEHDDIYDCVDFYKQPAFMHPLLKNNTSQAIPDYMQKRMKAKAKRPLEIGLTDGGCPTGTVPIMRSSKNNHFRSQTLSKTDVSNANPTANDEPGHHYAIIRTKSNPNKKFFGAESYFSLHNPEVSGSQFSASQMKLFNGPDSIQAGWMVNIDLFEDNRTRLFIHTTAGATQCYNLLCPGFVQVSSRYPVGLIASRISVIGKSTYIWKIAIAKDAKDGNWWLFFGEDRIQIGYWPKDIFTALTSVASQVQVGGEVFAPRGQFPPKMGTGLSPLPLQTFYSANCRHITVIDESYHNVTISDTETYTDGIYDYSIHDAGYQGDYWGHVILFGGAG